MRDLILHGPSMGPLQNLDYDGGEPTKEQQAFAQWVNRKKLFRSCTWEDFSR